MCRIAGIISSDQRLNQKAEVEGMILALEHGGPDDEGIYVDGNIVIGHRRLSIIDLSLAGHQPMFSEDEQIVISYNGEIYNYAELKYELGKKGVDFRTKSDTEVLLEAYKFWGTSFFHRLQGIFAFCLYDKKTKKVYLVRDQLGVKPLYYSFKGGELIFASEIRAFHATGREWKQNKVWKILFLAFGSLPHPHTTLESVYQIAPGFFLELDLEVFSLDIKTYVKANITAGYTINDPGAAITLMQKKIGEALAKNMLSDAPIGIFLSGGIDSSLLTLLADRIEKNVNTVSVNFEDATYDERPFQQMILDQSSHLEHHSYNVTEDIFWENLDDVWLAMDQPSIDGVNSYFVSKCAKQAGLKAVLSGLGADEIFGGYESINRIKWLKKIRWLPFKKKLASIIGYFKRSSQRLAFLTISGPVGDYLFLRGIFPPSHIAALLNIPEHEVWDVLRKVDIKAPTDLSDKEYASFLESKIYMTNQLLKDTDYMGMWHGIEVRVPFLDVELVREVASINPEIRFKSNIPKFLLTAPYADLLPNEIVYRKKGGFTFPFSLWMKNNTLRFQNLLLQSATTNTIVNDFKQGKEHWSKVWSLAVVRQFKS